MTVQGMSRGSASDETSRYILIPSGDKLPEIIDSTRALRLVKATADSSDYDPLQRIFDRIDDPELASTVRGMTPEGLLIYGTMSHAFALSNATEMKDAAPVEEVPASNITFLGDIRKKFAGSVAHYTGHICNQIDNIRGAFDSIATPSVTAPPAARGDSQPKFALAA